MYVSSGVCNICCVCFVGTLASGALYTFAGGGNPVYGLGYCFIASMAFAAASTLVTVFIKDDSGGLKCGACLTLVKPPKAPLPVLAMSAGSSGEGGEGAAAAAAGGGDGVGEKK